MNELVDVDGRTGYTSARMQGFPTLTLADASRAIASLPVDDLSDRQCQTLERLVLGQSEKEIGKNLGVSRHTVHVYVKAIYVHFKVSGRSELSARVLAHIIRVPRPKTVIATRRKSRYTSPRAKTESRSAH